MRACPSTTPSPSGTARPSPRAAARRRDRLGVVLGVVFLAWLAGRRWSHGDPEVELGPGHVHASTASTPRRPRSTSGWTTTTSRRPACCGPRRGPHGRGRAGLHGRRGRARGRLDRSSRRSATERRATSVDLVGCTTPGPAATSLGVPRPPPTCDLARWLLRLNVLPVREGPSRARRREPPAWTAAAPPTSTWMSLRGIHQAGVTHHDAVDRPGHHLADPGRLRQAPGRAGGPQGSASARRSSSGSAPPATRVTSRRTAATTPPRTSRARWRPGSVSSRTCCAAPRSARPPRTTASSSPAWSSPTGSSATTRPRRSCSAPARSSARTTRSRSTPRSPPLGSAINGKSKGDTVTYTAPNGKELSVEIVDAVPYAG